MSPPRVSALVPAAGSSLRMGGRKSKLLEEFSGATVLGRCLSTLGACPQISSLTVIARESDIPQFRALCSGGAAVSFVVGGSTRQESVHSGLRHLREMGRDTERDFVLVHDAARCLVTPELVARTVLAAFEFGAASAAVPVVDTMVFSRGDFISSQADRDTLRAIQTPQVFSFSLLWQGHISGRCGATDDASLVQPLHPVRLVPGERRNIKITTPADLELARLLAAG